MKNSEKRTKTSGSSITGALTGFSNRRGFHDQLKHEFKATARYRCDVSMLVIDVDDFQTFNDSFGHREGGAVLREVAALLLQTAPASDIVCRQGGEEFAVLLPNTSLDAAVLLGQRTCRAIASAHWKHRVVT